VTPNKALKYEATKKLKDTKFPLDFDEDNELSGDKKKSGDYHSRDNNECYKINHKDYELLDYDFKVDQIVKTKLTISVKLNLSILGTIHGEEKKLNNFESKDEKHNKEYEEETIDAKGREGILTKQVKCNASHKERNQPTITNLKWFSSLHL
jgi:hypothetical protein